ncbi:acyl-CoA reductase [Sphingobacterium sp. SRCM116780]|uniref:acyl-CoA reductase n=1 Tax=Sphingobacterium sp. SRCM116780 TaxID=2907623 RepID=UPI001F36230C|nr:acyl-CoA reductase [Sphingobacterium sp. SRCM116780]UIR57246.1 acyl-CoA reductase [Sphingobacterium sp. SRCM116780]
MTKKQRIEAFVKLADLFHKDNDELNQLIQSAQYKNAWYTSDHVEKAFATWKSNLTFDQLENWLSCYPDLQSNKTVGLVLAGNIPLVGFHDILCVLAAGFHAQIKVSSDDASLTTYIVNTLIALEPRFKEKIELVERLTNFDLVIATGSNNSSRYFEHYFGQKPHIIRKNRNSVAVITGNESPEQLEALGHDIFDYYGLGCRSVSKLFFPKNYNISHFYEGIESFEPVNKHFKYNNNYDYNKSIYLINADKHYDNGFLLLKEDKKIASPLAVVYYEEYENLNDVVQYLNAENDRLQCVTSETELKIKTPTFKFGSSQNPALNDYADGVNTLDFLFANQ